MSHLPDQVEFFALALVKTVWLDFLEPVHSEVSPTSGLVGSGISKLLHVFAFTAPDPAILAVLTLSRLDSHLLAQVGALAPSHAADDQA